jgi:plastocyanin
VSLKRRLGGAAAAVGILLLIAVVVAVMVDIADSTNAEVARGQAVVTMRGQAFVPRVLAIVPGRQIQVRISNDSWLHHTFTVPTATVDVELDPGQDVTVRLDISRGQSLRFFCRFHHAQGMQGLLVAGDSTRATGGPTEGAAGS